LSCLSASDVRLALPPGADDPTTQTPAIPPSRAFAEGALRRGGRPRMPDTPERSRLEGERRVREVIFGAQDGLLTSLGIVTGVGAADPQPATILLTGLVALVVGTVSMGVGEYVGSKSEREVVRHAIRIEQAEMAANPDDEFFEHVAYYRLKGFTVEEATMIVTRLAQNPEIWLNEMVRDEYGIDPRIAEGGGLKPALAMGGSFAGGAVVPLAAYLLPSLSYHAALGVGVVMAALALGGIGAFSGRLANRNPLLKGLELVGYGALVYCVSFVAGHLIPPLFGRAAVGAG
jgi:VIT1/CCC1 family predicted Fe2+/Mn2+ transporter